MVYSPVIPFVVSWTQSTRYIADGAENALLVWSRDHRRPPGADHVEPFAHPAHVEFLSAAAERQVRVALYRLDIGCSGGSDPVVVLKCERTTDGWSWSITLYSWTAPIRATGR